MKQKQTQNANSSMQSGLGFNNEIISTIANIVSGLKGEKIIGNLMNDNNLFENSDVTVADAVEEQFIKKTQLVVEDMKKRMQEREELINKVQKEFEEQYKTQTAQLEKEFRKNNPLILQPQNFVKILTNKKITDQWVYTQGGENGNPNYYQYNLEKYGDKMPEKTHAISLKKPQKYNNDCNGLVKEMIRFSINDNKVLDGISKKEFRKLANLSADGLGKYFEEKNKKLGIEAVSLKENKGDYKKMAVQIEPGSIIYNPALKPRKGLNNRPYAVGESSHIAIVIVNEKGQKMVAEMHGRTKDFELKKLEDFLAEKTQDVKSGKVDWKAVSLFPEANLNYHKNLQAYLDQKIGVDIQTAMEAKMKEIDAQYPSLTQEEIAQHKKNVDLLQRYEEAQNLNRSIEQNYNGVYQNIVNDNQNTISIKEDNSNNFSYKITV